MVGEVSKNVFSQSIWNLDTCHSIQHRRCIWVQQMSWKTVERRKSRRLWNHKRSSHIGRYRHGKHAISDKGTDWSRPLTSSKTDHRCALLHHLLTILCQHFWRFCVNISSDSDDCVGATVKVTRCLPPARWPSSDLICPIFSNKWLYLDISRILQIHDQGNSDILLSVGWSFKMANTWDHWSMHDDSNRSILLLEASKYFLRHLFASTFVV